MFTAIFSLDKVYGAELWLLGVLVCALIYLAVCLLFRTNRGRRGIRNVVWGLLAAEAVCDGAWLVIYYAPDFAYHNWGIGGVYGLFLWPALLFLAGAVVTGVNSE